MLVTRSNARLPPPRLRGEIWIGETLRREAGGRRLALGQRRIAAIVVGTADTVRLNADRVTWIVSLSLQSSGV